jgi:hypothetical protein
MAEEFASVAVCDVLDLATRRWLEIQAPPVHRLGGDLVAAGERLYLAGGTAHGGGAAVTAFDPAASTWTCVVDQLPVASTNLRLLAAGETLVLWSSHDPVPHRGHLVMVRPQRPPDRTDVAPADASGTRSTR